MRVGRTFHMAQSVDADRFTDAYLKRTVLPGMIDEHGKRPTPAEFRAACADARVRGWDVFPPCDNVDEKGRCAGHDRDESRGGDD